MKRKKTAKLRYYRIKGTKGYYNKVLFPSKFGAKKVRDNLKKGKVVVYWKKVKY